MDAEILFFMTQADQEDFFHQVDVQCDHIEKQNDAYLFLVGESHLLFKPSVFDNNTLYCGSLEIRSKTLEASIKDIEKAKKTFRVLRNWLKKHYWSRLAYYNKKDKLTPSRNHWLGPKAKQWKEKNTEQHHLRLSPTSWVSFNIGY